MALYDVIIIGAGTAGLTSAIYGARSGLKTLVFEREIWGGQIINSLEIENYPALDKVSGVDYATRLYDQATRLGASIALESIKEFNLNSQYKIFRTSDNTYQAKTVIIATGASHKKLGCMGEDKFIGRGVSYCATCDGAFYKDKTVTVVGGGNTALQEALFLAKDCAQVNLVHRGENFSADKVTIDAVLSHKKINVLFNTEIEEIVGTDRVTLVKIKNNKNSTVSSLQTNGVFVAIGLTPNTNFISDIITLDNEGYIVASENCKTNIEGVFVAGDVRTKRTRQLVTAASDGAIAAVACAEYISKLGDCFE